MLKIILSVLFVMFLWGCAEITPRTPRDVVIQPMSGSMLELGMSQDEVRSVYGNPTSVQIVSLRGWMSDREEWFYEGRYKELPLGTGFLRDDLYLYFDENSLTNISRESLAEREKEVTEDVEEQIK